MPTRPIHRWKSFWLGVLVVVFLGWAWFASLNTSRGIVWCSGDFAVFTSVGCGGATVGSDRSGLRMQGFDLWASSEGFVPTSTVPRITHIPSDGLIELDLPFWLLIVAFLLPWTAFLAWRWRKQRIQTKAHDAAPAH